MPSALPLVNYGREIFFADMRVNAPGAWLPEIAARSIGGRCAYFDASH